MIFQKFATTDIVAGRTQVVSSGFFNDGNYEANYSELTTDASQIVAFGPSSSYDVQNGLYYWDVYYNDQVHMSVSYGDLTNSASAASDFTTTKIFPFEANYKSYANILLSPTETQFSFLSGSYNTGSSVLTATTIPRSNIFIINFNANLYKNQIDPGQLEFSLYGTNGVKTFIDDSSVVNKASNVYNIIEGSIVNGVPVPTTSNGMVEYKSIGLFYPKAGIIILSAVDLVGVIGNMSGGQDSGGNVITFSSASPSTAPGTYFNTYQSCLFKALSVVNNTATKTLKVRKSELIPTTQYYVRLQNANFNYTNNPTFVSDGTDGLTKGTIKIPELRTNPTTYVTTVGLYNSSNELVAVAKLSQPIAKSFDSEYLLKVNLAY